MESTLAGWARCLFSAPAPLPSPAPHQTGIEAGLRREKRRQSRHAGSISMAMRRSASEPISQTAIARMSAANATGSAWKLPPDNASPLSAKISGLSETPFASVASVPLPAAANRARHP